MPQPPTMPALVGTTALDHLVFAPPSGEDRRLKQALVVTAALHLVLLAVVLPKEPERPQPPPKTATTLMLEDVRIQRKPPTPQPPEPPKPPKRTAVTVPMPEPLPVEPILELEPVAPEPPPLPPNLVFVPPTPPAPAPPPPPEPSPQPVRVGAGVELPERTIFVEPRYSEMARKVRLEGTVILDTVIDRNGHIRDIVVLRGLPMGLTEEAIRAVSKWRFEPPMLENMPIELAYVVTVRFQLR